MSKLGDALAAQKREAWVDWKDIPLTAEWQQEILSNIEGADNFLFVISPESAASPNCRKEIDHAVANHKRMVPVLYRAVPETAIPEALSKFQRIDFLSNGDFDANFASLITALDTDLSWVQMHTRLLTRAKEWEREGKDNSFLLHGKDLGEAERWLEKSPDKEPRATTLHSHYILASRHSATKRQRLVIGAVTLAFLIAVGLAIYAFTQRNVAQLETKEAEHQRNAAQANAMEAQKQKTIAEDNAADAERQAAEANRQKNRALARMLLAESDAVLGESTEASVLLAAESVRTTPLFANTAALYQRASLLMRPLAEFKDVTNSSNTKVRFEEGGTRVALNDAPGLLVLDTASREVILRLDDRRVGDMVFCAKGLYYASTDLSSTGGYDVREAFSGALKMRPSNDLKNANFVHAVMGRKKPFLAEWANSYEPFRENPSGLWLFNYKTRNLGH